MILSFGWTWAAFAAREKTCTRRDWVEKYARRWQFGTVFAAYDRSPRYGGHVIGHGRLVQDVVCEPLSSMPDDDYAREGFEFLSAHLDLLPASARRQPWYPCDRAAFHRWRCSGGVLHVVRFEILDVAADAARRLRERVGNATPATRIKPGVT